MAKRLLFSLLLSTLVVAGCGGDESDKTVIRFWHFWSEPNQKAKLMERIAAFEETYPDIKVQLEELSWNDGKTKLINAFSSGTAPDVVELGSDWVAQFSSGGALEDQGGMAGDSLARFASDVSAPGLWEGKTYAWPWIVATRVLFVNRDLLAKAGVDSAQRFMEWDDVLDAADKVQALGGETYGWGANGPDQHRLYKKILPFFWSNGGEVLNAQGQPVINSPENIAALEKYLELARVGRIETQKQLDQMFLNGKVAFWISGPWLLDQIRQENPGLRFDVLLMPGFMERPGISFAGGEYLAISAQSKNKAAAKKLIAFLTSPEQALAFAKEIPGGMAPADLSVASDSFLQQGMQRIFTEQLKRARMTPVHPKWLEIEEIIENEVEAAMLAKKDASQALNDAQAEIVALLRGERGGEEAAA